MENKCIVFCPDCEFEMEHDQVPVNQHDSEPEMQDVVICPDCGYSEPIY